MPRSSPIYSRVWEAASDSGGVSRAAPQTKNSLSKGGVRLQLMILAYFVALAICFGRTDFPFGEKAPLPLVATLAL
jgi:hypothetical protein